MSNPDPPQGSAPVMPPEPRRVSADTAMTEIREAVESTLSGFGTASQTAQAQMSAFMSSIRPDVEEALASGDLMSLGYLRDRIIMQAGRVSLGLIYQQRVAVANTVTTVLRILIKVAIGAI